MDLSWPIHWLLCIRSFGPYIKPRSISGQVWKTKTFFYLNCNHFYWQSLQIHLSGLVKRIKRQMAQKTSSSRVCLLIQNAKLNAWKGMPAQQWIMTLPPVSAKFFNEFFQKWLMQAQQHANWVSQQTFLFFLQWNK